MAHIILRDVVKRFGEADTLAVGDVTHILLFRGTTSEVASVQYVPATGTYEFWSQRPSPQLSTLLLPSKSLG